MSQARVRFARYRGLKSFRSSFWDPKESLPLTYAKIFELDDYGASRSLGETSRFFLLLHVLLPLSISLLLYTHGRAEPWLATLGRLEKALPKAFARRFVASILTVLKLLKIVPMLAPYSFSQRT